jgi:hypothetical protein
MQGRSDDAAGPQPAPPLPKPRSLEEVKAEQLFLEKSAAYPFLWTKLLEVAVEALGFRSLAKLKASFVKFDDAEATTLNDRIKEQQLSERKVSSDRLDVCDEITETLFDLNRSHVQGSVLKYTYIYIHSPPSILR